MRLGLREACKNTEIFGCFSFYDSRSWGLGFEIQGFSLLGFKDLGFGFEA